MSKNKKFYWKYVYKGDPILREMALLESATAQSDKFLKIFIVIRVFLPFFVRILERNYFLGHYWYEYIVTLALMYFYYMIFGYNLRFTYVGVTDFRRKLFFMKILKSMITVDKDKDFLFSTYFPTLNICWMKNLNSWMMLRSTCLDLGLKYTYRIFVYCSVFLGIYLVLFIFIALSFFGILSYNLPLTIYITGTYDIILIFAILFKMLKLGAEINEYFDIFKGILIRHKNYFWDIKTMSYDKKSK